MQSIRYFIEAVLLYALYGFFKILPVDAASGLGGWLGRNIGPMLGASGKAERHITLAMPDLSEEQKKTIALQMWDNLGRVFAEYPHLEYISQHRTLIEGDEHLQDSLASQRGMFFIGGHLANWEVDCAAPYLQLNLKLDLTYRAPNNPWAEKLLNHSRTLNGRLIAHPKSRAGGKALLKAAKEKHNIGMLIDQKYNEGIGVNFFGHIAMTNPVFVQLAHKYDMQIIPVQAIRTQGANFRLVAYEPLKLLDETGNPRAESDIIGDAHALLEGWIREYPGQWLWLHRRWKD